MQSNVELKQQLAARSIPIGTVAALASTPQSRIFPTDLSHFFKGRAIAPAKADAIRAACETLIDLSDALRVQPDWRNVDNVREAIALAGLARPSASTILATDRVAAGFEFEYPGGPAGRAIANVEPQAD